MLHPSKFFEWCAIRIGFDTLEIFDNDLKKKLMNIHPKNFIKSKLELPVYKVCVSYETERGNYKESEKYMILNNSGEKEYDDMWADMFARDYETEHEESIKNIKVLYVDFIGDAVLPIG
ncbi:MAG: hypothetical protein K1W19_08545 [Lachnospiraceae bacterium]